MTVESEVGKVHESEDDGGDADEDGPEGDEDVGQGCVDDCRIASYVFQDIKPVSLNDDGYGRVSPIHTQRDGWTNKGSCSRLEGPNR